MDATETLKTHAHVRPEHVHEVAELMEARRTNALEGLAKEQQDEVASEAA